MSLTEKIATKIGNNAKLFLNVNEEQEQIIVYGAINLFQMLFAILWVIIAGLLFGVFYEALIFSISASILRKYSGGVHASSPSRCVIIGTFSAVLAGILINNIFYSINSINVAVISGAIIIFAFITVFRNAPVDSIKKPIKNIETRKQFKRKSIFTIFIFSFIIIILFMLNEKFSELYYIKLIESISVGVLWQTITLTKNGINFLNKVDSALKYIIEGMGTSVTPKAK
ncbi:accessory gene regulator ArgB-like protein [Clostridium beijerinckii]|jgi:accessory gene regulator B|uniref:Accessory gene regulator B family protein n=2 Tax=Clostridium beijerinckii TaxID=1520 RepID=A0AAE2RQW9_CLOBE|nr:accessory gene regulator B family protein [Clostridium beijerinckii]ABR35303.1 Accessory gene regulator B [Clostridium beijerinckii NCIMB 8052]AIU01698.1 accessory gene regulator B [Clostridium beijerinckii ATCC 35702]MBF7810060.1 accessory gene regulator B family protein [Clostridium beijerinckii]NRT23294.1 accessory gene regulator B [Clostridium beijerinckii]NRT69135.1 accessory gene regulator B [Clostridium beijerinckii]